MKVYRVEVKCTNSSKDTCANYTNKKYFDCVYGCLYVTTDDPKSIYDKFGIDTVKGIEEIGIGYTL